MPAMSDAIGNQVCQSPKRSARVGCDHSRTVDSASTVAGVAEPSVPATCGGALDCVCATDGALLATEAGAAVFSSFFATAGA